jgi:hypothetical protein
VPNVLLVVAEGKTYLSEGHFDLELFLTREAVSEE